MMVHLLHDPLVLKYNACRYLQGSLSNLRTELFERIKDTHSLRHGDLDLIIHGH